MDAKLLHARLGHVGDVRTIAQQQGIKLVGKVGACSACERGKASMRPVKKYQEERTAERLELVHTDIAGPVDPSFEGSRYAIIFVDDYSRMRKIYTLRHKSEALSALQQFEKEVAKASGLRIQRLRSDQGGEFTGEEFRTFCAENGIKQEFSAAYTPQQNGIAERSWRTLFDMMRCKMITANLGRRYWVDAAHAAEYCLNRTPTRVLEGVAPYEKWHGKAPKIGHLRTFGCTAYVMVHPHQRRKLDDKAWAGIFLGYDDDSPSYRVYNPETKSVHLSRNVRFDEDDFATGHRGQKEYDGKRDLESFFKPRVTPAVTRSRARDNGGVGLTEEPARRPPTETPPILTPLAQAPPVPLGEAAINNNSSEVTSHEDGKETEEPPMSEPDEPAQSPAPPGSPTSPNTELEGINQTERQEEAETSSANGEEPETGSQKENVGQPAKKGRRSGTVHRLF